jgi:hypothetical protein
MFGFKKKPAVTISKMDIDFYQESKALEKRLRAVLLELGKAAGRKYNSSLILESLGWLKPYGIEDGGNFSFGVHTKGIRYTGMFSDYYGNLGSVFAAVEHVIGRWRIYKAKKLSRTQMDRGVRFLEAFLPQNVFGDTRVGNLAKGYTFNIRKYLKGK